MRVTKLIERRGFYISEIVQAEAQNITDRLRFQSIFYFHLQHPTTTSQIELFLIEASNRELADRSNRHHTELFHILKQSISSECISFMLAPFSVKYNQCIFNLDRDFPREV